MPFKPGQSGNPKGRPSKGASMAELIRSRLDQCPAGKKKSYKELIIQTLIDRSLEGDLVAVKLILHYHDGLPHRTSSLQHSFEADDAAREEELMAEIMKYATDRTDPKTAASS